VYHPLVIPVLLGFDLQPHNVGGGRGVHLRIIADVAFQQEELRAQLGEVVQVDSPGGIERHNRAVAREDRQRFGLHRDGVLAREDFVGFEVGPDAARQIDRAPAAGFVDGRHQHLIAQHELIGMPRAFRIVRKLKRQWVPGGVAVVADLQRVDVEKACQLRAEIAQPHRVGRHLENQGTQLARALDQFRRRVGIGRQVEFGRQHRRHGAMHHPQQRGPQRAPRAVALG